MLSPLHVAILVTLTAFAAAEPVKVQSTGWLKCDACKLALKAFVPVRKPLGKIIVDIAIPICVHSNATHQCNPFSSTGAWACEDLCKGLMPLEMSAIEDLTTEYSAEQVCTMFKYCNDTSTPPPPPYPGMRSNLADTAGEKKWPNWPSNGGKLTGTFVHITDLHVIMDYLEGANTDCGQPFCCRSQSGKGPAGHQAGKFGDWKCDLSPALFDAMMDAIGALEVVPDFVLNTGDDPAHDVWAQSKAANLRAIEYVAGKERNCSFGSSRPFVNIFGNHAPAPVNQFQGPVYDDWLYEGAASHWAAWLPDEAIRTLRYGGFYQMRLTENLRAFVMHSTMFQGGPVGSGGNWFFGINQTDMAQQFPWLTDALKQARARREKVYMLTHHSMNAFNEPYSRLLKDLTEEFRDVIVANFAGHAHTSFLQVLHDAQTGTKPIDVTYISGSGTPDGGNPAFRVFHYDLDTYEITDYDQYWVDMDQANRDGVAVYKKNHTATEHYGLKDLSGASWDALALSWLNGTDKMVTWQRYALAMTRGHLPAKDQDRHASACTILSSDNAVFSKCMKDPMAKLDLGDDHESPAAFDAAQSLIEIASRQQLHVE